MTNCIHKVNVTQKPNNSADLDEDLWQEVRSVYGKWEEGGHIGEHTGQDERVFGLVVQHGLQQLHALIDGQLLHSSRQDEGKAFTLV